MSEELEIKLLKVLSGIEFELGRVVDELSNISNNMPFDAYGLGDVCKKLGDISDEIRGK